ncbi:MAG: hypothetical protein U0350_29335 [Caldilineaceae bacterium]
MGTWLSWLALFIGALAFGYAWRLQQELGTVNRRLDRYNRALFEANDEIRKLREEVAETTTQLRVELKQRTGAISFQPEMTVREAQMLHPQTQQILAGFHLGGCSHCAVELDDTLAKVCNDNGLDLNGLLNNLNMLVSRASGQPNGAPQLVKIPNVELSL